MPRIGFLLAIMLSPVLGLTQGVKALVDAGDRAFAHSEYDVAVLKYKAAVEQTPGDAKTLFKLGVTLLSSDRKYDALQYLQKSYELKKDISPEIDYYMGH